MLQGTEGKRVLIEVFGFADEVEDEVAAADVVQKIGEELGPERVVAHVLNNAAAVGVCVSLNKLFRSGAGEPLQQQNFDGSVPGGVDERFVGEYGVREGCGSEQQKPQP